MTARNRPRGVPKTGTLHLLRISAYDTKCFISFSFA